MKSKKAVEKSQQYKVINLGPNFSQFWQIAKGQSFENQLSAWNEFVETPYQTFYDEIVWQQSSNPKWEERKLRRLREFFQKYPALYPEMMNQFTLFDTTLKSQIEKFTHFFPDACFDLSIYAAPTTTFNGKGGEGGDTENKLGKTILAFGIDRLVDLKNDPDECIPTRHFNG